MRALQARQRSQGSGAPITASRPRSESARVQSEVHDVLRSPGQALDEPLRSAMEQQFRWSFERTSIVSAPPSRSPQALRVGGPQTPHEREADAVASRVVEGREISSPAPAGSFNFRNVRIHADERAGESARSLNARAYTVGSDIVFAPGRFVPNTAQGRHLLAHELTHVLQQRAPGAASVQRQPDDPEPLDQPAVVFDDKESDKDEDEDDAEDGDTDVIGVDETLDPLLPGLHGPEPVEQGTAPEPAGEDTEPPGKAPMGGDAEPLVKAPKKKPKGSITSINVDLTSQMMTLHFSSGDDSSHQVSTGKGQCGTKGDPCPTQKEKNCTPEGTFTTLGRGDASTTNSHGDKMAWFVGLIVPGRKGIGIHNSQTADGTPRSHGCVRTGKETAGSELAKLINQRVIIGTTKAHIKGRAKTKPYPCPKKKKKKP